MSVDVTTLRAALQNTLNQIGPTPNLPAGPGRPTVNAPGQAVVFFDAATATNAGVTTTSGPDRILVRGEHNAIIVQMIPTNIGDGTPTAAFTLLDSEQPHGYYSATVDTAGAVSGITAYTKFIVGSVQPFLKAQIQVTHGQWRIVACPVPSPNGSTITVSGTVNLADIGGTPVGSANPLDVRLDTGGNATGVASLSVQGTAAVGASVVGDPLPVGYLDQNSHIQIPQVDNNGYVIADQLASDVADDSVASAETAYYALGTATPAAAATTATMSLGSGTIQQAGPTIASVNYPTILPLRTAVLNIDNHLTGQTINAISLLLTDAVGSSSPTLTYTVPGTVSIASGASGSYTVAIPEGKVLATPSVTVGFAAGVSAGGTVTCRAVLSTRPMTRLPLSYQSDGFLEITDATDHTLVAAPGSGFCLYLMHLVVINKHASTGTLVTLKDGVGGTVVAENWAQPAGGGWMQNWGEKGRPLTTNGLLDVICATTASDVCVFAHCEIGTPQ